MANRNTFKVFSSTLIVGLIGLVIFLLKDCKGFMAPAPPGIHGTYSSSTYNPTYKATFSKDSLIKSLEAEQLLVKSGRLHDYDPPWDSLRYLIDKIRCDTGKIEAYIEFLDRNESQPTFRVIWFNATPTMDDKEYDPITRRYYQCFEEVISNHQVKKMLDTLNGNR